MKDVSSECRSKTQRLWNTFHSVEAFTQSIECCFYLLHIVLREYMQGGGGAFFFYVADNIDSCI